MNIFLQIMSVVTLLCSVSLAFVELRRCLMMLQQNSYRNERFMKWIRQSGDSTSTQRLLSIAVVLVGLSILSTPVVSLALIFVISAIGLTGMLTARYKKPLVMTRRAWRILMTATVITVAVIVGCFLIFSGSDGDSLVRACLVMSLASLACYCASLAITMLANWLLKPVEKNINDKYIDDARRILASMPGLMIVGITGSYGKTSTKHYLQRILSEKYDTLMTPGSFNTTMGVVCTVREYLKPYNDVFIVEMGAKNIGDVKEICDLVHPRIGIVTAVGPQHLESFKTIENVQRAKFELVDSLPSDGLAVVNDDFPYIQTRHVDNVPVSRYAVNTDADYKVTSIDYDAHGTRFTLRTPLGQELEFATRLVGECNVSNLAAAIIVALHLEVPLEKIRYAVEHIEQVEHRLNMKRTAGGVTIIDDAYNSNPVGSAMALDVLARMRGGRRIVVTPGMIELGERQEDANRELGRKIATSADLAIVVNVYNRDAIVEGARDGGMAEEAVMTAANFAEAQQILSRILKAGDTVLYENDLPDTFK